MNETNQVSDSAGKFRVIPDGIPNPGILFVDHSQNGRSGHGGNCLTECHNGDILAFYSNVSGDLQRGHGTFGWSEYRRSTDGGKSWGEPIELPYSRKMYDGDEVGSALVFGTTTAPNGTVMVFVSHFARDELWVKERQPVVLLSHDHGQTWGDPRPLDPEGTVEDAAMTFDAVVVHDGEIFAVFMGGSANYCPGPFNLYVSEDNGRTFRKRSELPFRHEYYYVTAGVLDNGNLIVYTYPYPGAAREKEASIEENNIPYVISSDRGHTWSEVKTTYFAKAIRNPQMSRKIGNLYFLHGRSGHYGQDKNNLVLYASRDGIHWDGGVYLYRKESGGDCYSGNEVIGKFDPSTPNRLLIQSSIGYQQNSSRVNEHHWFVTDIEGA